MSKTHKKRNKPYRGEDAQQEISHKPVVHTYQLSDESIFQSWWRENKRLVLVRGGFFILALLLAWAIYLIV